jgi:hypothetical protein
MGRTLSVVRSYGNQKLQLIPNNLSVRSENVTNKSQPADELAVDFFVQATWQ